MQLPMPIRTTTNRHKPLATQDGAFPGVLPETINRSKPLTPIEKLLADKNEVKIKCRLQGKKLNDSFDYIRENSSGIIISGITSLLFPSGHTKHKPAEQTVAIIDKTKPSRDSALLSTNLLIVAKSLTPIVWKIVKPILIRWSINKVKTLLYGTFSNKNRTSTLKR